MPAHRWGCGVLLVLLLLTLCSARPLGSQQRRPCDVREGAVVRARDADSGWRFQAGGGRAEEGAAAWGSYVDPRASPSNFGVLNVTTSGAFSDADQVFAAGFLEGHLTAERTWDAFLTMRDYFTRPEGMGADIEQPMKWIEEQDAWVRAQCLQGGRAEGGAAEGGAAEGSGRRRDDPRFWQAVCLLLRQFDGLKAGYRARRAELQAAAAAAGGGGGGGASAVDGLVGEMSDWDFLFQTSNGDLYDIIDAQQPDQRPSWVQGAAGRPTRIPTVHPKRGGRHWAALEAAAAADPETAAAKLFSQVALSGKCSALIKVAPDLSDLFMGHATWDTFTAMLRIYKHYRFDLRGLRPAAQALSFSSYPGELLSDDDFYLASSGLVVMVTTNKIFNDELFERLHPRGSVLSWQRVRAANWLASSGEEWAALLDTHNSGTYNNQYMVVDLSRFTPGRELRPGLLWVAEQVPGRVVAADVTDVLQFGYWPSFNVPYFPEVYNASGYPDFISRLDQHGQHFSRTTHWLSYQESPRAAIFRRDQAGLRDLGGMKRLMRSNNWRSDPLSEGHPICAICGRGDLDPHNPVPRGCFDAKVTSYRLALQLQAEVVNGPTTDAHPHPLPPFSWHEPAVANLTHRGQPQRFKGFRFQRMDPAAPLADMPDACSAPGTAAPGGGEQGGAGAGGSASGEARGFWALLLGSGGRERAERATLTSSLLTS